MLEIKRVRQNIAAVEAALGTRGPNLDLGPFKAVDEQHRKTLLEIEALRHRRNVVSDEIACLKKAGDPAEAFMAEMRAVAAHVKELEKTLAETQETLSQILLGIPNLPHATVPVGRDSSENPVVKSWGEPARFAFEPKAHWDIGAALKILDLERATKIAGARFPLYFGAGIDWSGP